MQTFRHERLREQLQTELASLVEEELKDPRIGLVNVTRVDVSPDMSRVRVLVKVAGDESVRRESLAGLVSSAGYVRHVMTQRLRLRRAPAVVFEYDRSSTEAGRMEELFAKIHEKS